MEKTIDKIIKEITYNIANIDRILPVGIDCSTYIIYISNKGEEELNLCLAKIYYILNSLNHYTNYKIDDIHIDISDNNYYIELIINRISKEN